MTQYFQSRIYSSARSGQQAHHNSPSDPSFCTWLPWGGLWGAFVSFPRSFSCHHRATKAGESPAGMLGLRDVVWGRQGLGLCVLGLCCAFGIVHCPPHPPPCHLLPCSPPSGSQSAARSGSVRPCRSCPRRQQCRGAVHGVGHAALHARLPAAAWGHWFDRGLSPGGL